MERDDKCINFKTLSYFFDKLKDFFVVKNELILDIQSIKDRLDALESNTGNNDNTGNTGNTDNTGNTGNNENNENNENNNEVQIEPVEGWDSMYAYVTASQDQQTYENSQTPGVQLSLNDDNYYVWDISDLPDLSTYDSYTWNLSDGASGVTLSLDGSPQDYAGKRISVSENSSVVTEIE